MRATSPWLAAGLTLAVLAAVPILVFSPALPPWMATAATVFLVLAFLARAALTGHLLGHTPADWPLLALLLLLPVGLWASPDPAITYPRTDALVASAALFWVVAAQRDRPWLRYSGWALLAGGVALALVVFTATSFPAKLPGVQIDISALQARLQTPFLQRDEFNPNLTGHVMALLLAPAVALTLKGSGRGQRLAALLVSGLLAALLVLSQSRGALLAALVAIPVVTVAINWRWLWLWGPLGLLSLGAALLVGPRLQIAALAVDTTSSINTLQGRAELWSRALYLMQDFPFTGVGLGMPEPVIKLLYPTFLTGPDSVWSHVHNTYLQVGSEMGLPGLIAFLALLLTVAAVLVRQVRRTQAGIYQGLSVGLLGSWSVFVVHSLVDTPTFSPIIGVSFFVLLGLMVAVATSEQRTGD
ncbi:MAG TPA: O-antigen ligase family protein [Anaerolineae bacterium]|nr:O-antigen ligase family protein [Anaerolineae bacterium]